MRYTITKVKGEYRFNTTGNTHDFVINQSNAVRPFHTAEISLHLLQDAGHEIRIGESAKELKLKKKTG